MHEPVPEIGKWLRSVVEGHIRYYGVPMNGTALALFRYQGGLALATRTVAPQPERARPLGPNAAPDRPLAASCSHLSSLSAAATWASSPEAGAGCGKAASPDLWRGL